jgi:hypothetical protein
LHDTPVTGVNFQKNNKHTSNVDSSNKEAVESNQQQPICNIADSKNQGVPTNNLTTSIPTTTTAMCKFSW